jgi:hypothetical protein
MPPRRSAKAARAHSARDLRRADQSRAALIGAEATPSSSSLSNSTARADRPRAVDVLATPVRAELIADDTCIALGIEARAHAPVLALCRKLVEAGVDPASPLEAWRGSTLSLKVRSTGEGACLEVRPGTTGTPIFIRTGRGRARAAPPMRAKPLAATGLPPRRPAPHTPQARRVERRDHPRERRDRKRRAAS